MAAVLSLSTAARAQSSRIGFASERGTSAFDL
jgi:hypothetical protein